MTITMPFPGARHRRKRCADDDDGEPEQKLRCQVSIGRASGKADHRERDRTSQPHVEFSYTTVDSRGRQRPAQRRADPSRCLLSRRGSPAAGRVFFAPFASKESPSLGLPVSTPSRLPALRGLQSGLEVETSQARQVPWWLVGTRKRLRFRGASGGLRWVSVRHAGSLIIFR